MRIVRSAPSAYAIEQRFEELLEAAPDGILEVDRDGRIMLMNAEAERLFGYPRQELLGQTVDVLVPQALRGQHSGHRLDYWKHPIRRPMGTGLQLQAVRKDGRAFPAEISLSPVHYKGGIRTTAIVRDITERRRVEERLSEVQERHHQELASANAQLELRNREVERANRLKSEFLASMSHELRTPLHTIIGFAELLGEKLEGPLNPKQERFVGHIHRDSLHLLELINDILDLSKIEAGRLEIRPELFDFDSALHEVLATVKPQAMSKTIDLQAHVSEPMTLEADRIRVKEILYNLLSNAVKFTPEHGQIRVQARRVEEWAEVAVSDNGIGIAKQDHTDIFDPFHQVGSTTRGVREGTGLGLAITRRLVEQHGGRVWVESAPGHGSRFTFTIPLAAGHAGEGSTK